MKLLPERKHLKYIFIPIVVTQWDSSRGEPCTADWLPIYIFIPMVVTQWDCSQLLVNPDKEAQVTLRKPTRMYLWTTVGPLKTTTSTNWAQRYSHEDQHSVQYNLLEFIVQERYRFFVKGFILRHHSNQSGAVLVKPSCVRNEIGMTLSYRETRSFSACWSN